jgi:hypothetical protein
MVVTLMSRWNASSIFEWSGVVPSHSTANEGGDVMRKVVVYELLSLDGVAEDPDEFITEFDE